MQKTTLYFPAELFRALREASRRAQRSQADMVREAVEQYLRKLGKPRLKSLGAGADGKLRGAEVEEWLEREWGKGDHD
ncbi:MAG: CopG family transcriptional regulator [Armatimonadota bacterium]